MLMSWIEKSLNHKNTLIPKSGYNVVGVDSFKFKPEDVLFLDGHYEDHGKALARLSELNGQKDHIKYYIYDKNTR
jgi:hypothetical protein